jgi:RNA polymerase sigma-70 factor (ECF subfamily)
VSDERERVEKAARAACDAGEVDRATTALIEAYGPEILGFLVARLRDPGAGGDAFSMFCEDLWRGLARFEWRCSARVWSYTLARNAANRYAVQPHRRAERNVALSKAGALGEVVEQVRSSTLAHLRTTNKSRMRQLREQLEPEEQTILMLRVDKELSWLELARVMADEAEPDDATLEREAARLRKRFQLVKGKLRKLAEAAGLLAADEPS